MNTHSTTLKSTLNNVLLSNVLSKDTLTQITEAEALYTQTIMQSIAHLRATGYECMASVLTEIIETDTPPHAWRDIRQHRVCGLSGRLVQRVICVSPFVQIDHNLQEIAVSLFVCTHMTKILQDLFIRSKTTSACMQKTLTALHGAIETVDSSVLSLTTQKPLHDNKSPASV